MIWAVEEYSYYFLSVLESVVNPPVYWTFPSTVTLMDTWSHSLFGCIR